jgi:excisionase family DNA binding protein
MSDAGDEILTVRQAAKLLGVSAERAEKWIRDGGIPSFRTPAGWIRVKRVDVMERRTRFTPPNSPTIISVECCGLCPMAWDGTELDDDWRCTAVDLGAEFRSIGRTGVDDFNAHKAHPEWCPLRVRPILIRTPSKTEVSVDKCSRCGDARPKKHLWFRRKVGGELVELMCPACAPEDMQIARRENRREFSRRRHSNSVPSTDVQAAILAKLAEGPVMPSELESAILVKFEGRAGSWTRRNALLALVGAGKVVKVRERWQLASPEAT